MNKQERITKLMELLQASLDGKEIEQCEYGEWYAANIADVSIVNIEQFRVKPSVITEKYRVALLKRAGFPGIEAPNRVYTITHECNEKSVENHPCFIRWLSDWQTYTVEE